MARRVLFRSIRSLTRVLQGSRAMSTDVVSISYQTLVSSPSSLETSIGESCITSYAAIPILILSLARGGVWIASSGSRAYTCERSSACLPCLQRKIAQACIQIRSSGRGRKREICGPWEYIQVGQVCTCSGGKILTPA